METTPEEIPPQETPPPEPTAPPESVVEETPAAEAAPAPEMAPPAPAELPQEAPLQAPSTPQPLSPSDERTWAMVAHLSVLLNLVTAFLGTLAALVIYLVFKNRSRYVAYQSMQAFVFQMIVWVGSGLVIGGIWLVTGLLSIVLVGLLCIPFALIATVCLGFLPLVALVYGMIGAVETSQGKDFRYWLVGDWVRGILEEG